MRVGGVDLRIPWILGLAALFGTACTVSPPEHEAEVRGVFEAYKNSLIAGDSTTAAGLVSEDSVAYFGELRRLARYATQDELEKRSPVDQMLVLTLRLRSDEPALSTMTARDVLAFLIGHKALGTEYDSASELDQVGIDAGQATARHVKYGQVVNADLLFVQERKAWRQDLTPVLAKMTSDFERLAGGNRGKRATAILVQSLVELTNGKRLKAQHFEPFVTGSEK